MRWKIASASARGKSHERSGLPNQDAHEHSAGPRGSALGAVLAVADGHGSVRHFRSQIGSSLAVHAAVTGIQDSLAGLLDPPAKQIIEKLSRRLVDDWRAAVQADFENNPFTPDELEKLRAADGEESLDSVMQDPAIAYGATLLAVAASEKYIIYLQLGDGDILSVDASGETTRPIPGDDRLIGNQTTSLCQSDAWNEFRVTVVDDPSRFPALVLLSTDGYANSFRSEKDFLQIGKDYLQMAREGGLESLAEELPAILSEASEQGSGDDITLGILQNGAAPAAAVTPPAEAKEKKAARPIEKDAELKHVTAQYQKARKTLRQIQIGVTLVVLIAAGVLIYAFRKPLFHGKPRSAPVAGSQTPARPGGGTQPTTPAKHDNQPPKGREWVLELAPGSAIPLQVGQKIPLSKLVKSDKDDDADHPYAEVTKDPEGMLMLTNLSDDPWAVQLPGRTKVEPPVGTGEGVKLEGKVKITFRTGVVGTIQLGRAHS